MVDEFIPLTKGQYPVFNKYPKFIVDYQDRSDLWWGDVNQRISRDDFCRFQSRITAYLNNRKLYVIDCHIGTDIKYRLSVRVVAEYAWQALAVQNLFLYDGQTLTEDEVMEHCKGMAAYKRPSLVVFLDEFPLNRVGKTDYVALRSRVEKDVEEARAKGGWDAQ